MNLKNLIEGINILKKYYADPDGYHLSAEHDIIYLDATLNPVSEDDIKTLFGLGWFQEGVSDDEPYNLYESWCAYV